MVYNSIHFLNINPNISWPAPTLALSLFAAAFYMVARGLQDVVDPRMPNLKQLQNQV
jgi:ABC-type dipeptide/oligopeptide/nickel transport system permease subunit